MVEIDGQQLRYRNTQAQWTNFVWPNPQGTPGARITATTFDNAEHELLNHAGRYGLNKLIDSAKRTPKEGGVFELSWTKDAVTVSVDLKIVSGPQQTSTGNSQSSGCVGLRLPKIITTATANVGSSALAEASTTSAAAANTSLGGLQ
jgi:type VI secretion system protein ImpL